MEKGALLENITRNGYRVLGLPADSPQPVAYRTAASLQRSAKLQIARTSSWDLPWFAPVERNAASISDALARLNHPAQRLRDRLLWLHQHESAVEQISPGTIDLAIDRLAAAPGPLDRHDAAVLALIACFELDPNVRELTRWSRTLQMWSALMASEDFWSAFIDLELESGFEPAALFDEVQELRASGLALVANVIGGLGREAAACCDSELCRGVLAVLRAGNLPEDLLSALEEEILGPTEDRFQQDSKQVCIECWKGIRKDRYSARTNRTPCEAALGRWQTELRPRFEYLLALGGVDSGHAARARHEMVQCLLSLANALTWADQYTQAEELLLEAKRFLPDGAAERERVEQSLTSIAAWAADQRLEAEHRRRSGSGEENPFDVIEADEDALIVLCERIWQECRSQARREDHSLAAKLRICHQAYRRYRDEVALPLAVLRENSGDRTEYISVVKSAAGRCLCELAADISRADDFVTAEVLLREAKGLVTSGTPLQGEIDRRLEAASPRARRQRLWKELTTGAMGRIPSLARYIGTGFSLCGHTDEEPEFHSYLTTYYFILLFIPLIPIRRYRVIKKDAGQYRFLSRAPLQRTHQMQLSAVFLCAAMAIGLSWFTVYDTAKVGQAHALPGKSMALTELKSKIEELDAKLKTVKDQLRDHKSKVQQYERLRKKGRNIDQSAYRRAVTEHNNLVPLHNELLAERNRLAAMYDALIKPGRLNAEHASH